MRSMAEISREAADQRRVRETKLLARHPAAARMAIDAATTLRRTLGVTTDFASFPAWLSCIEAEIDPCGRPYVLLLVNQWTSNGGRRMSAAQDGEVPELPVRVDGVPVFSAVQGCFGHEQPGRFGVPCVDPPEKPAPVASSGLGGIVANEINDLLNTRLSPFAVGVAFGLGAAVGSNLVRRWLRK